MEPAASSTRDEEDEYAMRHGRRNAFRRRATCHLSPSASPMSPTEFVEALVRVADLKVEEQGTLAAKLDAFLQNTFLPAVPQQALDGGTLALADAIGVE